ncbi:pyridoxal-phosphate dependent enzyme [Pusillimonas sp. ANT_WB101]|uniref:pyridoxal-phosphate dependent enzyme n=1 Tax=Pusillimonas sp. ANT_WB101 TaxID=2597356 RepID=UPI0011EDDA07|nr:pyridoxal-phosphate dependent enzyme [Pusillimonas sp. ANT_WB101]KAA0910486.1 pyridoxal-phosphate dependent enzyme [Pusillimonas sp. ANT_WB101]
MNLHIHTPLIESRPLSLITGSQIWLKIEALQPTGSFKIRGIGAACQEYARRGKRRFISSSGGNAGIAVAYAGRCLSIPVTVVVPETTTERARSLIKAEHAQVIVHGKAWDEANTLALSLMGEDDAFLHPFDDPLLWKGHATLVDELVSEGVKPDAIMLSVGGGGLYAGVVEGLRRNNWGDIPVITAETIGTDSLAQSIQQGKRITLDSITSIATSLGAEQVCEQAWRLSQTYPTLSAVVNDHAALNACEHFLDDHRILVEPACGASLALAYEQATVLQGFGTIVIVVCGGVTASIDQIRKWNAAVMR